MPLPCEETCENVVNGRCQLVVFIEAVYPFYKKDMEEIGKVLETDEIEMKKLAISLEEFDPVLAAALILNLTPVEEHIEAFRRKRMMAELARGAQLN